MIMDALTALHNRVSEPRLTGPAPSAEQQEALFQAALRAPDHARLRPWRFLVLEGQGLERLGELFAEAALARVGDPQAPEVLRAPSLPQRAPMVVIAISSPKAQGAGNRAGDVLRRRRRQYAVGGPRTGSGGSMAYR